MPIIRCPKCTLQLMLPDGAEGKRTRCGFCDHIFEVLPAAALELNGGDSGEATSRPEPRPPRRSPSKRRSKPEKPDRTWLVVTVAVAIIITIPTAAGLLSYFVFGPGAASSDDLRAADGSLSKQLRTYLPDYPVSVIAARPAALVRSKYGKAMKQGADAYGHGLKPFLDWSCQRLCRPEDVDLIVVGNRAGKGVAPDESSGVLVLNRDLSQAEFIKHVDQQRGPFLAGNRQAYHIDELYAACRIDARTVAFGLPETLKTVMGRNSPAIVAGRLLEALEKIGGIATLTRVEYDKSLPVQPPGQHAELSIGISVKLEQALTARVLLKPADENLAQRLAAARDRAILEKAARNAGLSVATIRRCSPHVRSAHDLPALIWNLTVSDEEAIEVARCLGKDYAGYRAVRVFKDLRLLQTGRRQGRNKWSDTLPPKCKTRYRVSCKALHRYRIKVKAHTPTDLDMSLTDSKGRVLVVDERVDHDCEIPFINGQRQWYWVEVANQNRQTTAKFDVSIEEVPLNLNLDGDIVLADFFRNGDLLDSKELKLVALPHRRYRVELTANVREGRRMLPEVPLKLSVTGPGLDVNRVVTFQRGKNEVILIPPLPGIRHYTVTLRREGQASGQITYSMRYSWAD